MTVFVLAPSALLLEPGLKLLDPTVQCRTDRNLGWWQDRAVNTYLTGGLAARDSVRGFTQSANVEVLWNGVHASVRHERHSLTDDRGTQTVRGGYLFHPVSALAGGVMVGYRTTGDTLKTSGLEIGFPIAAPLFGNRAWMRWEPTYVIVGKNRGSFSPRLRYEGRLFRSMLIGLDFEAKGFHERDPLIASLMVGWRQ